MARLLLIRDAKGTGRADCVPGEPCDIKPDGFQWSKRELVEFDTLDIDDLTVDDAVQLFFESGIPTKLREAQDAEEARVLKQKGAALVAAAARIEAAKLAAASDTAKAFDDGTLFVDPLLPEEKRLPLSLQKDIAVYRVAAAAEASAREAAVNSVAPFDETARVEASRYPSRLRHIDLGALSGRTSIRAEDLGKFIVTKDVL